MKEHKELLQMDKQEEESEIDLLELLYYYRVRLWFIIAGFLTGAIIVGLVTFFLITPKYTASSKLYMVSSSSDSVVDLTDLDIGTSLSNDYEELLRARPIIEDVIREEKLPYTYEQLFGMLQISTIDDTRILVITAESTIPDEAQRIANCLADMAVSELPRLMDTSKPNIAEKAILPQRKSSPSLTKNTLVGAVVGMLLVIALLTFRFLTDDTLQSAEDVEKAFGVMPLTVIPEGDIEEISDEKEKKIRKAKKRKKKKKAAKKEVRT